jgi:hypothetical protein
MYDAIEWFSCAITGINWLDVITALSSAVTACVAYGALSNWKRQDKAKRESEFLDSLLETTHKYIAEMIAPITLLEVIKIGMESHVNTWEDDDGDKRVTGAVRYIKKNGEQDAKRLIRVLESVQESTIKLRSLAAKGQVFKFDGYAKCLDAVAMLTWHFDRIEAFLAIIGSPSLNWENQDVSKRLKDVIALDPNEMRKSIEDNNVAIIKFVGKSYERIYG